VHDDPGKLTAVVDPLGNTTRYGHDEHGAVTSIVDPLGNTTTIQVNAAGLPLRAIDPAGTARVARWITRWPDPSTFMTPTRRRSAGMGTPGRTRAAPTGRCLRINGRSSRSARTRRAHGGWTERNGNQLYAAVVRAPTRRSLLEFLTSGRG
jgi:YD repeat-containing protein